MARVSDLPTGPAGTGSVPDRAAATAPSSAPALRGLVVDWGGVLTGSLDGAMSDWAHRDGVDFALFRDVMRQWVGRRGGEDVVDAPGARAAASAAASAATSAAEPPAAARTSAAGPVPGTSVADLEQAPDGGPAGSSPVHRLERGELSTEEFEKELAAELAVRGAPVPPEGLLQRLLAGLAALDERMLDLLRRAREAGIRTALLSNSWGDHYPDQLFQGLFDAVVISGRVGMRKPEPEIFRYAVDRLGLPAGACVMVDDLPHNVTAAVAVGMVGVVHRSYEETLTELEVLFGVPLRRG